MTELVVEHNCYKACYMPTYDKIALCLTGYENVDIDKLEWTIIENKTKKVHEMPFVDIISIILQHEYTHAVICKNFNIETSRQYDNISNLCEYINYEKTGKYVKFKEQAKKMLRL